MFGITIENRYLCKIKKREEAGRNLTEEEKQEVIRKAELAYKSEFQQNNKSISFDKIASVTLL